MMLFFLYSARTNRATVPETCKTPKCIDIMPNHLVMGFEAPVDGGNEVLNFMLKIECMDVNPETGLTTTQVSVVICLLGSSCVCYFWVRDMLPLSISFLPLPFPFV